MGKAKRQVIGDVEAFDPFPDLQAVRLYIEFQKMKKQFEVHALFSASKSDLDIRQSSRHLSGLTVIGINHTST